MKTIKKSEWAQGLVEYALIIVLIAIVVIVAIEVFNVDVGAIAGSLIPRDETAMPTEEILDPVDEVGAIGFTATPLPTIPPTVILPLPTNTSVPTETQIPTPTEIVPVPVVGEVTINPLAVQSLDRLKAAAQEVCPEAEWFAAQSPTNASEIIIGTYGEAENAYLYLYLCGEQDAPEDNMYLVVFDNSVILAPDEILISRGSHWGDHITLLINIALEGDSVQEWINDFECRWEIPGMPTPLWIFSMSSEVFEFVSNYMGYMGDWVFSETCE